MNQAGNTHLLAIVFLLILSSSIARYLEVDLKIVKKEADHYRDLLCTKELNLNVKNLSRKLNRSNKILKLIKIGDWASIFLPHMKIISKASAKTAEKLIKGQQIAQLGLYQSRLFQMRKKHCSVPFKARKTPYQIYGVRISRDKFNQIKMRGKKWTLKHRQKQLKATTLFVSGAEKSRTRISKKALPW